MQFAWKLENCHKVAIIREECPFCSWLIVFLPHICSTNFFMTAIFSFWLPVSFFIKFSQYIYMHIIALSMQHKHLWHLPFSFQVPNLALESSWGTVQHQFSFQRSSNICNVDNFFDISINNKVIFMRALLWKNISSQCFGFCKHTYIDFNLTAMLSCHHVITFICD